MELAENSARTRQGRATPARDRPSEHTRVSSCAPQNCNSISGSSPVSSRASTSPTIANRRERSSMSRLGGTVLASLQRFCARLWFVLKLALGPAKGAARSWGSWWPTFLAVLTAAGGVLGFSVPKDPNPGWVVAGVLAILLFLFARAAYKLHAERDRPFPKVYVDAGAVWKPGRSKLWDLVAIKSHVTNQERTNGISLTFFLFYRYGPNAEDWFMVPPAHQSFVDIPENLKLLQVHPVPLNLDPMKGDAGELVFVWHSEMGSGVEELRGVDDPLKEYRALRLQVTDHVSGRVIEIGVPGRYGDSP